MSIVEIWNRHMKAVDEARARFTETFSCTGRISRVIARGIIEGIYRLHKKTIKPELFFEHAPQPDFTRERLE